MAEVRRGLHAGDGDEAQARVLQLLDLLGDRLLEDRVDPTHPVAHDSRPTRSGAGDLADLVDLDDVPYLDVVVPGEADTTLVAGRDLPHIVLEPAK